MKVLGIETSCDDTSICLYQGDKRDILFYEKFSQEKLLEEWGGVVPEIAARNHLQKLVPLLKNAFKKINLTPYDIDLLGITTHPGLLGPLLTGLNTAKTISLFTKTPIVPINHLYAHLEAIHIDQKVNYPYLGLLVSGGHSIFFEVSGPLKFKILGHTIDDAAGEAFDKGGRLMGLPYPSGKIIDELATDADPERFEFPIGLRGSKDAKLSYSGLKTSLRTFLEKNPTIKEKIVQKNYDQEVKDLCASYQKAIIDALSLKLRYALKEVDPSCPIVVGGGVACNSKLREVLKEKYHHRDVHFVSPKYCTDNGAMIAHYAYLVRDQAIAFPESLEIDAKSRFIEKTLPRDMKKKKVRT